MPTIPKNHEIDEQQFDHIVNTISQEIYSFNTLDDVHDIDKDIADKAIFIEFTISKPNHKLEIDNIAIYNNDGEPLEDDTKKLEKELYHVIHNYNGLMKQAIRQAHEIEDDQTI